MIYALVLLYPGTMPLGIDFNVTRIRLSIFFAIVTPHPTTPATHAKSQGQEDDQQQTTTGGSHRGTIVGRVVAVFWIQTVHGAIGKAAATCYAVTGGI